MKVLAIDTATAWQSVALLDDQRVVGRRDQDATGAHTKLLLPTIDRLLTETGLSLSQLDGLVVSIGPGSFTGLRVGLATMLGFRSICRLPLAVVPTLEGMAWNLRGTSERLCPVLNSRKGELYWAVFRWTEGRLDRVLSEQVGTPTRLGSALQESAIVFGEGWSAESASIRAALPPGSAILEAPPEAARPSAVSIGLAGIAKLLNGERAGAGVSPFYVQRPEAELKYEQSGGVSPLARRKEKIFHKLGGRLAIAGSRKRHSK